jgi:ABC-type transport system involved in multi-copper enzyme maturation permease subunit
MLTVLKHTLIESFHKRMAFALMVISVLIFAFTLYFFRIHTQPDGKILISAQGGNITQPAEGFVREYYISTLSTTAGLWTFLGVFALAPLLSSYLDTGTAGLLFTKALARWQIFVGRVGGAFTLFVATLLLLDGLPAIYFWLRAGVSPARFLVSVSILAFSFLTLVVTMAVIALQRNGLAPAIIVAFLQLMISGVLIERANVLRVLNVKWLEKSMNFAYYVLPKNSDLVRASRDYMTTGHIANWMPFWSTALFMAVVFALSIFQLERKSL